MSAAELDSSSVFPTAAPPSGVSLGGVRKTFGARAAVDGIDLEVAPGEFVAIVGPSGSGKSTLLRLIAGLEQPDAGEIRIGGRDMDGVPARERDIAMVFQGYALYPHLTVFRNLAVPLELRKLPREAVEARVWAAAELLDIGYLLNRRPGLLSGGQRQRVALARALVREPALFLLDEPLGSLDAKLRNGLRAEITLLHRRLGTTFLYVTHEQTEAMMMADRVVVMNAGRIEQVAPPQVLYDEPANMFVAGFIGAPGMNLVRPEILGLEAGGGVVAGIRPEHLSDQPIAGGVAFEAMVELVEPMGATTRLAVRVGDEQLVAELNSRPSALPGGRLRLWADPGRLHFFDAAGGRTLHGRQPEHAQ